MVGPVLRRSIKQTQVLIFVALVFTCFIVSSQGLCVENTVPNTGVTARMWWDL